MRTRKQNTAIAQGCDRRSARFVCTLLLLAVGPFAHSQPAPECPIRAAASTGSISGRVQNEVTGTNLNMARITVKRTDLSAFTGDFGTYRLAGFPGGTVTLEAFYSGLDPQLVTVNLAPGQSAGRDIKLTSRAIYGDKAGVVKLDAFVLSASKLTEGEALATNEQRFAANRKNVALDAFGDVIEGNVAEFMRFLPGITVDYSDVMPLGVSVRGFDPNMTNITSDGASLANASRNATTRSSTSCRFRSTTTRATK